MKSIFSKSMTMLVICATLFAFTSRPGGEAFEIYLNNELVLQRYGNNMDDIKSLRLNQSAANEKLSVKYNHCGKVGKNRHITIRNNQDKILKVFKYPDAPTPMSAMEMEVKDLLTMKKGSGNTLRLSYSSSELAKERILVNLLIPDVSK